MCAAAQVCREAGARVTPQRLRARPRRGSFQCPRWTKDRGDCRRVDLVAGSPVGNRHHVGVSSPAGWESAGGEPHVALEEARRRKETTYPELVGEGGRARLVVLAAETGGGRWSDETAHFLRSLAKAKAESVPLLLQNRVKAAWLRRWSSILACSAGRAFALSLLDRRPNPGHGSLHPLRERGGGGARGPLCLSSRTSRVARF